MSGNLIKNGNFETGDLKHWTTAHFDIPERPRVEKHEGSYKARMVGGRSDGQLLRQRFKAAPGTFTLTFSCAAPTSIKHEGPPDAMKHAFVLYIITGFKAGSSEALQYSGWYSGINPAASLITFTGEIYPGAEEVEVSLSIPSDPFANKGPCYFDKVSFVQSAPQKPEKSATKT